MSNIHSRCGPCWRKKGWVCEEERMGKNGGRDQFNVCFSAKKKKLSKWVFQVRDITCVSLLSLGIKETSFKFHKTSQSKKTVQVGIGLKLFIKDVICMLFIVYLSILSICMSVDLSVYLSICLSVYLISLSVFLSSYLSIFIFIYLSIILVNLLCRCCPRPKRLPAARRESPRWSGLPSFLLAILPLSLQRHRLVKRIAQFHVGNIVSLRRPKS